MLHQKEDEKHDAVMTPEWNASQGPARPQQPRAEELSDQPQDDNEAKPHKRKKTKEDD